MYFGFALNDPLAKSGGGPENRTERGGSHSHFSEWICGPLLVFLGSLNGKREIITKGWLAFGFHASGLRSKQKLRKRFRDRQAKIRNLELLSMKSKVGYTKSKLTIIPGRAK